MHLALFVGDENKVLGKRIPYFELADALENKDILSDCNAAGLQSELQSVKIHGMKNTWQAGWPTRIQGVACQSAFLIGLLVNGAF